MVGNNLSTTVSATLLSWFIKPCFLDSYLGNKRNTNWQINLSEKEKRFKKLSDG